MRQQSQLILLLAGLFLTACSSTSSPTFTGDGEPGYRITCGGFFGDGDTGGCYQKAGELCANQGYRILQTSVSSMIVTCRNDSSSNAK